MKRFICVFSCLVLICSGCGADHMAMALRSYNRNHNSQENIHLVYHQLDCALERSENNSQKALIFYIYGLLREEQEDIAAAESYYRRSLHFSPRFLDPIVKLADCCFRKKEYAEALQLYREAFFIVNDDMKDFEDGKPNPSHILSDPYIKYAVENNLVPSVYCMGKYPKKNALHGESARKMSKQIKILIENKIKAAERMIQAGDKAYIYDGRNKVSEVRQDGRTAARFEYHTDGQVAKAIYGGKVEEFLWDGLALIRRGETAYVNEPYVTGGNPVLSSKDGVMFNDMLGSTLSVNGNPVDMTSFGETADSSAFFTGKPYIGELGYAFLFRAYDPAQGKWTSSDPLGYPDGWNNLAYVNNCSTMAVDWLGAAELTLRSIPIEWTPYTHLSTHISLTSEEFNNLNLSQDIKNQFQNTPSGYYIIISGYPENESWFGVLSSKLIIKFNRNSDSIEKTS